MSLPPVSGPVPGPPGLPGLPDDEPPVFPAWLETEWLDQELGLDREEPSEAELLGLWPDPMTGAPDDASELRAPDPAHGFTVGGPMDQMVPGPELAGFAADVFETGL